MQLHFPTSLFHKSLHSSLFKPLKSEAIHKTGLSGNVVASFFPLIIYIYIYIYIYLYMKTSIGKVKPKWNNTRTVTVVKRRLTSI